MDTAQSIARDRVVRDHRSRCEAPLQSRGFAVVRLAQVANRADVWLVQPDRSRCNSRGHGDVMRGPALYRSFHEVPVASIGDNAEIGRVGDRVRMNHHLPLIAEQVLVAEPVVLDSDDLRYTCRG